MSNTEIPGIGDLMTGDLMTLRSVDTVDRARQTLNDSGLHALPIVEEDRPIGMVTLADCEDRAGYEPLGELIVRPLVTLDIGATVGDAASLMRSEHIHHLLMTEGDRGEVVGILSSLDLLYVLTI